MARNLENNGLGFLQRFPLKHDWMKDFGSEVARQPEGEVARQAKSSQSIQPNPNPDHDRTGKPVVQQEQMLRGMADFSVVSAIG